MYAQAKLLVPTIKQIIKLGNDLNYARDDFDRRYPSTGKLGERMEEYYTDPALNQAESIAKDFMMNLSTVEIDLIRSIMYIGRDERRFLNRYVISKEYDGNNDSENEDEEEILDAVEMITSYYNQIKGDEKDIAVDHMLEKVPFPDYLKDGLSILEL